MMAQAMVEPLAPPTPSTPSIAPARCLACTILLPPRIMVCAASERDSLASASQGVPDATATSAPPTSAKFWPCGRSERSTSHGVTPACRSTSQTKRAAACLLSSVARTPTEISPAT